MRVRAPFIATSHPDRGHADFAAALLKVWLGDHPPADDLKAGMLGG